MTTRSKIACLKKAEKEQCLILRLAEFRGKRSEGVLKLLPGMEIRETDMMEWDDGEIMPAPFNDMIKIILNPFEIKTFKLRKADHAN